MINGITTIFFAIIVMIANFVSIPLSHLTDTSVRDAPFSCAGERAAGPFLGRGFLACKRAARMAVLPGRRHFISESGKGEAERGSPSEHSDRILQDLSRPECDGNPGPGQRVCPVGPDAACIP